jgi:hypothetical protein
MEAVNKVKGKMFIVFDQDCKTPIAKGWIMDAEEVTETIDASSKDEGTQYVQSIKTVVRGDITHYPFKG